MKKNYFLRKLVYMLKNPKNLFYYLMAKFGIFIPDKNYLSLMFKLKLGYKLNLVIPQTFNEKLQWLKLYDRRSEYTTYVDKYAVREYIAKTIGEEYLIPLLGVWNSPDEIDFDKLPNKFVLKCNHDSGGLVICKDKSKLNIKETKAKLNKSLKRNYYLANREWPYKNVPRKIIAEKYMVDESGYELKDYKIFCFNGEPKLIQVDFDRFTNHLRNIYTTDWKYINVQIKYPTDPDRQIKKPKSLEKMLDLSRKISSGIPHVRTDFYCIDDKVYFGELTFYHGSGYEKFTPYSADKWLGSFIKLPDNKRICKL